jgi:hypothetical protein
MQDDWMMNIDNKENTKGMPKEIRLLKVFREKAILYLFFIFTKITKKTAR